MYKETVGYHQEWWLIGWVKMGGIENQWRLKKNSQCFQWVTSIIAQSFLTECDQIVKPFQKIN